MRFISPFLLALAGLFSLPGLHAAEAAEKTNLLPLQALFFRSTGAVRESDLRALLPDTIAKAKVLDTLDAVQKFLHRGLGWYQSRISSHRWEINPDGDSTGLEVWLESGPRTRLGSLRILGTGVHEETELLGLIPLSPGLAVTDRAVEKALEQISLYYADRGYPFCNARISAVDWESPDRLALTFRVEQGTFVRFGTLAVKGAKNTRMEVIRRITGLNEGEPYSEKLLSRARDRLLRSGLFREVKSPQVTSTSSPYRADLLVELTERPSNRFEAALGTGGAGSAKGLAGYLKLGFNNLFGTSRTARVDWQRSQKDWLSLLVAYREPWLGSLPLSLDISYRQEVRDSLYTSTNARIELSSDLTDQIRAGLGVAFEKASPGSETYPAAEQSTLWSIAGLIGWSDLARPTNPVHGFEFRMNGSAGKRRTGGKSERELRAALHFARYSPIFRSPHVLALSGGLALVARGRSTPGELPYHTRIPLGGVLYGEGGPMVRGHADEVVRGRRVGWFNLEYRYLLGRDSRLFAFYDFGAAQVPAGSERGSDPQNPESWRTIRIQGYGAGLQAESRLGLISIAVAFSPEAGIGEGRLYLQLMENF